MKIWDSVYLCPHQSVTTKINQVFFIFNIRELSVNRKDLRALSLVGLNSENLILDPLPVQPTIHKENATQ